MARANHGVRLGAAVFVAGLSLAGPQALGVAAADSGEDSAVSADAPNRSRAATESTGSTRGSAVRSKGTARSGVQHPRPAAAARTARGDSANTALAGGPDRVAGAVPRPSSASPAQTRNALAVPAESALPAAFAVPRATTGGPAAAVVLPKVGAATPGLSPAPSASTVSAVRTAAPVAAATAQRMGSLSSAIMNLFDRVGAFLSSFPGHPITELMSGALWLVRKTIFPVGADVGLWGTAACVTTGDCSGKDLTGALLQNQYLAGVKFQSTTLEKADLRNTNLTASDLSGADLRNAKIDASDLDGARLYTADMTGVSATNTTLVGADLVSANLTNSNFTDADLELANLGGAVLTGVTWGNATCPDGSHGGCHGPVGFVDYNPGTWLPDQPNWNSQTKGKLWYLYNPTLRFTAGAPMQGRPEDQSGEDGIQGTIYNDTGQAVMVRTTWYDDTNSTRYTSSAVLDPNTGGSYQLVRSGTLEIYPNVSIKPGTVYPQVLGVQVTAKGQYYDVLNPPTVRFDGGGGTGAAGRAIMYDNDSENEQGYVIGGQVVGVEITDPGTGYTSAPTVVFEGGGGEGAVAKAIMGGEATSSVNNPAKLYLRDNTIARPETAFTPVGGTSVVGTRTNWKEQESHYEIWGSTTLFVKRERDGWTVPASDAYKNLYGDPNTRQTSDWAIFTIRIKNL